MMKVGGLVFRFRDQNCDVCLSEDGKISCYNDCILFIGLNTDF